MRQTDGMPIVDNAVYVNGVRTANPDSLDETFELLRERHGIAWIGLYRPTPDEVQSVASEFGLHPLAVEDTLAGHQRPKIERYGDTLFIVLRPARYLDAPEEVEFGEVHMFIGPDFAITIRHAESPDLGRVRKRSWSWRGLRTGGGATGVLRWLRPGALGGAGRGRSRGGPAA